MNFFFYHFTQVPLFGPSEMIAHVSGEEARDAVKRLLVGHEHDVYCWHDITSTETIYDWSKIERQLARLGRSPALKITLPTHRS